MGGLRSAEDGTIPLEDDREPTPEEIEEAWGDLLPR